jgi:DNA-binding NtrC family response regulator
MSLQKHSILILHNNPILYESVQVTLESQGYCTEVVSNQLQLGLVADKGVGDAIIIDGQSAGMPVVGVLQLVVGKYPYMPVLVLVAEGETEEADGCIRNGAFDVIAKPVDSNRLISSICKAFQYCDLLRQNRKLEHYILGGALKHPELFENIITKNHKMLGIFKIVETIGTTMNPVLITGEAGVGKRLIARTIHMAGQQEGAFFELNAADNEESFIDSLLNRIMCDTDGESAGAGDGEADLPQVGTVYLGSIDALSEVSQTLLLHLLKTREGCKTSQHGVIQRRIRIISASEKPIEEILVEGKLRRDLCHHLCAHHIHIPPLRERREDIPLLLLKFIRQAASAMNMTEPSIQQDASKLLQGYDYPGNVSELRELVLRAVAGTAAGAIGVEDIMPMTIC